jgi:PAS domain S-box-containing protein
MESLLHQVLEQAPDAILVADGAGIIRYWNRGAELIFGHGPGEALGRSLDLIIPENLRSRHWEGYGRVMAGGETKYATGLLAAPGLTRDGVRVSLEFSIVPLRDKEGNMAGFGTIMRDVTERRERERALQAQLAACAEEKGPS